MNSILNKYFWFALIAVIFQACQKAPEGLPPTEYIEGDLPFKKIAHLEEYPELIGEISYVSFLDPEHFIVVSNVARQVLVFNKKGEQVRSIGKIGRGKFEFLEPALVKASGDRIFVWCNQQLKLMVFALDGTPLEEIFLQTGIKDFVVWENLLCIYGPARHDYTVLKIFDLDTKTFLDNSFGTVTNEHLILSAHAYSGGLSLVNHYVYFSPIDRLKVYRINLKDFTQTYFQINCPAFVLEKIEPPAHEIIPNPFVAGPLIFGSNRVDDIYAFGDYIVAMATVGDIDFEGLTVVDYSERRKILYFLNHDLKPQRKIKSNAHWLTSGRLNATTCDGLYAIKVVPGLRTFGLYRLDLAGL